jgi:hypothetical protein
MMPILARIVFTGWRISTKPIDRQDECFRQGLGLARLALRPGLVNHWLRHVMKEVNEGIKWRVDLTAVTPVPLPLCLAMTGIGPPLARSLAGLRDHRIDEYEQCDRHPFANERSDEACQRLRNKDNALRLTPADGADHGGRILRQAGGVVSRRKRDRDRLIAALLELRRNQVPVPCAATGSRYEDEGDFRIQRIPFRLPWQYRACAA